MYRGSSVGVVVPVYNEAEFIGDVIETVPSFVDKVFVIDDRSTDETWSVITEYVAETASEAAEDIELEVAGNTAMTDGSGQPFTEASVLAERLVPVRHQVNSGRGAAVKTGYRLAMINDLDVVAVMDGDGQMDPDILDRIIDPVVEGTADYAKGNRLVSLDHCRQMSNWRLFGNTLLTGLTMVASGHWRIRDPQNGYTAISGEALDRLTLDDLYDDYGFLNDLLIKMNVHDFTVVDVPMDALYGDEESGIRYGSFVPKLSLLLFRGLIWRLWTKYVDRPDPSATAA
ncbi:glycosyltransferase family 2 protein [Halomicroarcula sp. GCM10025324]|uniref:glycosyltransferase family 2 protein n=1 Tax=Haloarcula TaxID=2237 RepID=UPI0023E8F46B|nr:glycosyltransferase family 2 protein [Halomicroarcula sp. ZS-22-S1]